MRTICWFRQDLRIADHPALSHACSQGEVIPVFILDQDDRKLGGASKWWLHHSLKALEKTLGALIVKSGNPKSVLDDLAKQYEADAIYWNRSYEPHSVNRDTELKTHFKTQGIEVQSFTGSVLYEPWEIETGTGGPYKVYTPFWKSIQAKGFPKPLPAPIISLAKIEVDHNAIDKLDLLPNNPNWAKDWETLWTPGENGAHLQTETFLEHGINGYGELRNRPDLPNVSRLSPHIHFGEISPRSLVAISSFFVDKVQKYASDINKFQAEIAWRDFANHLMFHFPNITEENWKPAFDYYPWRDDEIQLKAWQQGMTGYPMVDAGMRELWHTGYMHNRIRMLVGSFLVKHLQMHWKHGEAWFWDTLLDADLANNTSSWQWIAGSGADAAPYFRIFNPLTQGPKFDPNGEYVRQWCPELSELPNKVIHAPHEASALELRAAGVELGKTYPLPIVDHKLARTRALEGYEKVKEATANN